MKKIILAVLCAIVVLSLSGCFQGGQQYENIDTTQAVDPDSISQTDYPNTLDGLVSYFKALHYLPKNTEPTEMLSEVIGAKKGYRYIFTVNGSQTIVELYEYDPAALDENAQRVIGEVKENGSFHLFNKEGVDTDTTYPAYLSDNGKYMMLYTDTSNNNDNLIQTKSVQGALKIFYTTEPQKTEENSDTSKTEDSTPTSKTEDSTPTSKTEDSTTTSTTEDSTTTSTTEDSTVTSHT